MGGGVNMRGGSEHFLKIIRKCRKVFLQYQTIKQEQHVSEDFPETRQPRNPPPLRGKGRKETGGAAKAHVPGRFSGGVLRSSDKVSKLSARSVLK